MTAPKFVGYQNIPLHDDKQALACGFVTIGAEDEGIYLTDMIPECSQSDGDIFVEVLNEFGVAKDLQTYYYYKNSFGNDDGWWNDEDEQIGEDIDDVFFAAGEGLWITAFDGSTWNFAGQVYDADKELTLADNKQMFANPYPTGLSLSKNIWIDCTQSDGDVFIEMLNEFGVAKELQTYYFYYNSFGNDDGWWNDEDEQIGEDIDDVVFPAGQGLWVTGFDGAKFQITSPLK